MFRNHHFENDIMLASAIDLKIANSQHSPSELRQYIPVISDQGTAVTPDGGVRVYPNVYSTSLFSNLRANSQRQTFVDGRQGVENRITSMNQGVEQIITTNSWFPSLRLVQHNDGLLPSFDRDLSKANELSHMLSRQPSWNSACSINTSDKWCPTNHALSTAETCKIWDINGNSVFQFVIVQNMHCYAVLPITVMQNINTPTPYISFSPQRGKRVLLNEHLLNQYPGFPVFLTTNILDATYKPTDTSGIYLANLGHYDWLDKLDFTVLRGRSITIICDGTASDEQYTIALLNQLNKLGLTAQIINNSQGVLL